MSNDKLKVALGLTGLRGQSKALVRSAQLGIDTMPVLKVSSETLELINQQVLPGYGVSNTPRKLHDGDWEMPVDEEVFAYIAASRLSDETDDDVVSRLVRPATKQLPS